MLPPLLTQIQILILMLKPSMIPCISQYPKLKWQPYPSNIQQDGGSALLVVLEDGEGLTL